jgi:hypothetical protein
MRLTLSTALLALSAPALALSAAPASAAVGIDQGAAFVTLLNGDGVTQDSWNHGRRGHHRDYDRGYGYDDDQRQSNQRRDYDEPNYRNNQTWRGNDGRTYCRRSDGTVGLVVGGAAGALIGRDIAGRRGDRTLGTVLGAAAGALIGRAVDQGGSRCR